MQTSNPFTGNLKKDLQLQGKSFKIKEDDEVNKVRFLEVDTCGYYVFKILDKDSEVDLFLTRLPKQIEVIK